MANPKAGRTKVIVGMSGGVDSSVAALLLQQQGYAVEGLFMKNWDEDDGTEYCTAMTDLMDAAAVCQKLGIHLHTANFARQYWDNVFEHFLAEYRAGRTPNPDILCNREIKFKVFLDYADSIGADLVATGHYARLAPCENASALLKGLDDNKDQSYFLHAVPGTAFERTLFPVGELEKTAVRKLAETHGLVTHAKKDSTGICFIGERRFKDFLEHYLPASPGPIIDETGRVLGEHQGLMFHTLGQRQGLGIGGVVGAAEEPWYVAEKNLADNTLLVVQGGQHPRLFHTALSVEQCYWIDGVERPHAFRCCAKTRYRQPDQHCEVHRNADGSYEVIFDEPQRAMTPGQSVVFYEAERCLGGGIIETVYTRP